MGATWRWRQGVPAARHSGRQPRPGVLARQLTEEIWGPEYAGEITGITVLVHRLRNKLEDDPSNPRFVQTVWHAGYRLGVAREGE